VLFTLLLTSLVLADSSEALLVEELDAAMAVLDEEDENPHYVAIALTDSQQLSITARSGTLGQSNWYDNRFLDVDLRVGTPELDSTHPLRGFSALDNDSRSRLRVPVGGHEQFALRHAVRSELDKAYRDGRERIVIVRANLNVKVEEEDTAPDFEPRDPVSFHIDVPPLDLDQPAWERVLVNVSTQLDSSPLVHQSSVTLNTTRTVTTFVDTEGSRLSHGRVHARLSLQVQTTADDGDVVDVFKAVDVHNPSTLPSTEEVNRWAKEAVHRLEALRDAPRGEPYSGPVVLNGRAAGVFFHEVFGHRVEGHRQKRDDEGKTFADHVGKKILPDFIDVYDDPTIDHLAGEDLNGHYLFDSEGVAAQRAELVEDGSFVGFLMGRSPLQDFKNSNGHGRRSTGNFPQARMGNTIIEASETISRDQMRQKLIAQLRKDKLPFGYIVEQIDGGFTMTGRVMPNAFNVRASASWRVFSDGRPDILVRGIDLVGTPLVAFSNLVAASDEAEVFNGTCGAESGWVPVSAVAPAMLFRKLEFQLKEKGQERPPLLDKPSPDTDGTTAGGDE
jgi:TldD protein